MPSSTHLEEFMQILLAGDRVACRDFMQKRLADCDEASSIYHELLWPALEKVEKLYRADRINSATEHMATRIARTLVDQAQLHLHRRQLNGKRVIITCADGEPEELGAQVTADLFEANGWRVYFLGGGVSNDEVLMLVSQVRPDLLLVFGTQPCGVPGVRRLVDLIRDIGVNPTMKIMVTGGVFNRAEGLWREVAADLFSRTAANALEIANAAQPRIPQPRRVCSKKRRPRHRSPLRVAGSG